MSIPTSVQWSYSLDLEDVSLNPSDAETALRLAREAVSGTLGATGKGGDCVEMQFDFAHALVLYMTADGSTLRPHFPHRKETGQGIEEFFCACCGVQLGDESEMLSRCMSREEGFRLCREILHGRLPDSLPQPHPGQPYLPGLEAFAIEEGRCRRLEWPPLQGRRKK
jgi:hypothetical protein